MRHALVLVLSALLFGCTPSLPQARWLPGWTSQFEENIAGISLGLWPKRKLELYAQWISPRLLEQGLLSLRSEEDLERLETLLQSYTVIRVVARNLTREPSDYFDYDLWSLLAAGKELKPVVPTGQEPTRKEGFFLGTLEPFSTLSGWLIFPKAQPGQKTAYLIYNLGEKRITLNFPPILRR
jgi:hypothetical protein